MITCFPDPYLDELMYSVYARYHTRMGRPSSGGATMQKLLGSNANAVIDLPSHFGHLTDALPPGHCYTIDYFIDNHTLLPFYSPFLTPERVKRIRSDMAGNSASAIHKTAGITPSSIRMLDRLRYCVVCADLDRKNYGESYWHRIHQLPGIEVCPLHETFLEESNVQARNRSNAKTLVPAEQETIKKQPRLLDLLNSDHKALLKIAQDAAWLIDQRNLVPGFDLLHRGYLTSLTEKNLALDDKTVHVKRLMQSFKNYYSPELLKQLQCEVDEQKPSNWLLRLHKDFQLNKTNHPLRHLLLIQFLGQTAQEFFQKCTIEEKPKTFAELKPFGEGPWPCLNPACRYFQELKIEECEINSVPSKGKKREKRIVGVFSCSCGYKYSRTGPDTSPKDRFRADLTRVYGEVWDQALKDLWEDSSLTLREIARQLNSHHNTLKSQAIRLGLRFPRQGQGRGAKLTDVDPNVLAEKEERQVAALRELESRKAEWLRIRTGSPHALRRTLRDQHGQLYSWLKANDADWLEAHSPPRFKRTSSARQVDWESRDLQLSALVRQAAIHLTSDSDRPRQITANLIGKHLDKQELLARQISKLPLTAKALTEVVETTEQVAVRRVRWATEFFLQENINPAPSQLLLRAGVYALQDVPEVKEALETAREILASLDAANRWKREAEHTIT